MPESGTQEVASKTKQTFCESESTEVELGDVIEEVMATNAAMAYPSEDGEEIADYSKYVPICECPNTRLFMESCKAQFERKVTN